MPEIKGYRELAEDEVNLVNLLKTWEDQIHQLLEPLTRKATPSSARWLSLARTHLETGMMFAVKAVTRPEGGLGNTPPKEWRGK